MHSAAVVRRFAVVASCFAAAIRKKEFDRYRVPVERILELYH